MHKIVLLLQHDVNKINFWFTRLQSRLLGSEVHIARYFVFVSFIRDNGTRRGDRTWKGKIITAEIALHHITLCYILRERLATLLLLCAVHTSKTKGMFDVSSQVK